MARPPKYKTDILYYIMNSKLTKMKVPELRAIAEERGLKGYSKMKKDELVTMINSPILVPQKRDLVKNSLRVIVNKVRSEVKSFADWLISYVPPPVKNVVNEKWESLKSTVLGFFVKQKEDVFELEVPKYWRINYTNELVNETIRSVRGQFEKERYSTYLKSYFYNDIRSLDDIHHCLMEVYKKENNAFKLRISFGYVTEKPKAPIKLYRPGQQYFHDQPVVIKNNNNMNELISTIDW